MPTEKKTCVIVVDPYYQHLTKQLKQDGHNIIAVLSPFRPSDDSGLSFDAEDFSTVLHQQDSLDDLITQLKDWQVERVYNGFDTGSKLWVLLTKRLTPELTPAVDLENFIGNKFGVNAFLASKGVEVSKHKRITETPDAATLEGIKQKIGYPVILKPTESGGSFGVFVCDDEAQLLSRTQELLGCYDKNGDLVAELVVEELLIGQEHSICIISNKGVHHKVATCCYDETIQDGVKNIRTINLLSRESETSKAVHAYVSQILDAMEIKFGQFLIEVMMTESGPRLIEVNARISGLGGIGDVLFEHCNGFSHAKLASNYKLLSNTVPRKPELSGKILFTSNVAEIQSASLKKIDRLNDIDAVKFVTTKAIDGSPFPKTIDVLTSPALCVLIADSEAELSQSIQKIENLEKNGILNEA
ncbi:ATP-grasp domain-containing protein [Pseudoalteromonas sp. SCSIO 43210]